MHTSEEIIEEETAIEETPINVISEATKDSSVVTVPTTEENIEDLHSLNVTPAIVNSDATKDFSFAVVPRVEKPSLIDEISSLDVSGYRSENANSIKLLMEAEDMEKYYYNKALNQEASDDLNTSKAILIGMSVCNASWCQKIDECKEMKLISNDGKYFDLYIYIYK